MFDLGTQQTNSWNKNGFFFKFILVYGKKLYTIFFTHIHAHTYDENNKK